MKKLITNKFICILAFGCFAFLGYSQDKKPVPKKAAPPKKEAVGKKEPAKAGDKAKKEAAAEKPAPAKAGDEAKKDQEAAKTDDKKEPGDKEKPKTDETAQTEESTEEKTEEKPVEEEEPKEPVKPAKARFWAGDILAAEVSMIRPEIINELEYHSVPKPEVNFEEIKADKDKILAQIAELKKKKRFNKKQKAKMDALLEEINSRLKIQRAYAIVYVKPDKGRSLGIWDYYLSDGTSKFNCWAVSEEDNPFDMEKWQILKTDHNKVYRMLFVPDVPNLFKDPITFQYEFRLIKDAQKPVMVKFKNKKQEEFTPASDIPPHGILGTDY